MYTVIVPRTNLGFLYEAIFRASCDKEVETIYTSDIDLDKLSEYINPSSTILLMIGIGLKATTKQHYQDYIIEHFKDTPFTRIYHTATWGETFYLEHVVSTVDSEKSPITTLFDIISTDDMLKVDKNLGVTRCLQAMEEYHHYDFLKHRHSLPILLMLTAEVFKENTYKELEITKNGVTPMDNLWETQYNSMQEYIQYKTSCAKVTQVNEETIVVLTYAEKHTNEVANELINNLKPSGLKNIIAFVGKHTQGDDMFQVRATPSVNVGDLVYKLANGQGNDHAGFVYLGESMEPLINAINQAIFEII